MDIKSILVVFVNCFILLIPILLLNIFYFEKLSNLYQKDYFWKDIPPFIKIIENITRIVVSTLPLLLKMEFQLYQQKIGFALYTIGITLYFLSWG